MIHDICIIGAGPVGLALASAVSKFFPKVVVLEQSLKVPAPSGQPNQRVLSVNGQTRHIMESLGAWQYLDHSRVNGFSKMIINNGELVFNEQAAYIIEYDNLVQSLAQTLPPNTIQYGAKIEDIKLDNNEYVKVNDFYSKLIVGSDGNKSKVKQVSQIGTYGVNYSQMGVVCTVERKEGDSNTAYQTYLSNGSPLALLPLWGQYSSIVWSLSIDDYRQAMAMTDEQFLIALNSYQAVPLSAICNKRMAFPLNSLQADRYIGNRVALIGDAAHSIHPMAGQGFNMGINDAALLANCIIRNAKTGNDFGTEMSLQSYETKAKLMNYSTSMAMSTIKSLYESTGLNHIRKLGSQILNQAEPLKQAMIQIASQHPLAPTKFEWQS